MRARGSRGRDTGFAVAACAALTAYNNLAGLHPWHSRWYAPLNACATVAAVAAATASGLTPADIGFGRGAWSPGRPGWLAAGTVAAGWLVVAAVPATRPVLDDKRIEGLTAPAALYQATIRIPVGTVVWEETAFRGILQAAARRVLPEPHAIAVTSAAFGLWHIRPTLQALHVNDFTEERGQAVVRTSAVVVTAATTGAVLSWLRERTGSLTAPVLVHAAANCGALLSAYYSRPASSDVQTTTRVRSPRNRSRANSRG